MAFTCMFANLVVGVGIALRSENARNVGKTTWMKELRDDCGVFSKSIKSAQYAFSR